MDSQDVSLFKTCTRGSVDSRIPERLLDVAILPKFNNSKLISFKLPCSMISFGIKIFSILISYPKRKVILFKFINTMVNLKHQLRLDHFIQFFYGFIFFFISSIYTFPTFLQRGGKGISKRQIIGSNIH